MNSRHASVIVLALPFLLGPYECAIAQDRVRIVLGSPQNECRVVNTYPEYWVDGKPFFESIANFNYYRLPRDRWAEELLRLKSMGINTLDILPMWAWHEPEEGALDFGGRTNPLRDLNYLLRLAEQMGFKVALRPGPYDTNDWRNGGYPDWLLRRPEYHMTEQTILEGRYPRLSALQYEKQEEAATGWLQNETHLRYARKWYHDVLGLVSPLLADKGGPIIGIQLDDDVAIGIANYSGPNFWKYMGLLRQYAKEATHGSPIPYFIDAANMRVNAAANDATPEPLWNMGQDYQIHDQGGYSTVFEAAKNKFLAETVKTQPLFIGAHFEFQAGWRIHSKDTYASPTDPSNTLMATRVMFQNGLKGLGYWPMHDTLNPAGFDVQWANRHYGFESAVNYAGEETGRAVYVRRNGRLVSGMGALLAAAHLLADAGLVYPMATFPQADLSPDEANYVGDSLARMLWSGIYDHYNFELLDSDHTPQEDFERYKLLLLPTLVSSQDDLKLHPHLGRYSDKAQRMMQEYVVSGGNLIVFPSLPTGEIFDQLLSPLGNCQLVVGEGQARFANGTKAALLNRHSVLTLPKSSHAQIKVFARDERGGIVGARFPYGKGKVLFFGADFTLWSAPPGTGLSNYRTGPRVGSTDYPEDVQRSGRAALPALMKEAGVQRKVYYSSLSRTARDPELYTTELVEDWDTLPFERRAGKRPGYGFVGVTNFSPQESYSAEINVTDPRVRDFSSPSSDHYLGLPVLTLPPRESVMLPIRIPFASPYWKMAPGLEPTDEVYYATCELSGVTYDGSSLRLELTAPMDGEVALRLSERPRNVRIDGEAARMDENAAQHLWILKIPKGPAPHFIRTLQLDYLRQGPHISIDASNPWIAGEKRTVRLRVENPRTSALEGSLDLVAGTIRKSESRPASIPARSSSEFSFPVEIPADAVGNLPVQIDAMLHEKDSPTTWGWRSQVIIHHPFTFAISPFAMFPLREDQSIPIVHPILASLNVPGEATFHIKVKNWRADEQTVTLTAQGDGLTFSAAHSRLVLPPNSEITAELRVVPRKGTGAYRFEIRLQAGSYQVSEGVVLAAVQAGEAVAYTLDYDRDGFEDVIVENQNVRCFLSPFAGGQSFGFVLKDSNVNAFDSVGAMRDNFSMRIAPEDSQGLPDWNSNYRGLYNRPYSFRILSSGGASVRVALEYTAPDIYPKGVKVQRTLSLRGDDNLLRVDTTITPRGVEKPQSYVLEGSVPFRGLEGPNYNQWFCLPLTRSAQEFVPLKDVDLALKQGAVGTVNRKTGETFALMVLSPADEAQLSVQNHSALIRIIYPAFFEGNKPYTYRVAYYLGREGADKIESLFARVKSGE